MSLYTLPSTPATPPTHTAYFMPTDAAQVANPLEDFIMARTPVQMGLSFYKIFSEVDKLDHEKCIRDINYAAARRMVIK